MAVLVETVRLFAKAPERLFQRAFAAPPVKERGERGDAESFPVHVPYLLEPLEIQDWALQADHAAVLAAVPQEVAVGAQVHVGRRDDLLAHRIDGRIGDLGEQLLEIVEKRLGPVGKDRERDVDAHGPDRLGAAVGHMGDRIADVLVRVPERLLPEQELLAREPLLYYVGHVEPVGVQQFLLQPLPERVLAGVAFLEFVVAYNAPLGGVHREHVAGLQRGFPLCSPGRYR